ncbi:MAG TPA: hypothetical protein VER38_01185 [Candidatus Eisenbacteria bacterium]|nr:hypothetical protein [Candidatus Eisenbacteria bacterium]
MPLRARSNCLVLVLLAAQLATPSCQWAGDTKAATVSYLVLKRQVDDVNSRIHSAVQNGEADRIPGLDRELNASLDAAMNQASAMNLLDREHLSISVATARRCITDMDRYAQSGDLDLLRAQVQQLEPTIAEIQELFDRAERTTTAN